MYSPLYQTNRLTRTLSEYCLWIHPPSLILDMNTPSSEGSSGFPGCPCKPPLITIPSFWPAGLWITNSYCNKYKLNKVEITNIDRKYIPVAEDMNIYKLLP